MAGRTKGARRSRRIAGTGKRDRIDPTELGALDYKRSKIKEIRADVQRCRDESKLTALAQLHRLEVQIHDEITMALDAQSDPIVGMTSNQLVDFITAAIVDLPGVLQDEISGTLSALQAGRVVKLNTPPPKPKRARKKSAPTKRATKGTP